MGVVLKRSETMAGPKLRAGLRDAPEIAPRDQITAAMESPIADELQGRLLVESVEPRTVRTSIMVPTISATSAANTGMGRLRFGSVLPRSADLAISIPTIDSWTTAAMTAPTSC